MKIFARSVTNGALRFSPASPPHHRRSARLTTLLGCALLVGVLALPQGSAFASASATAATDAGTTERVSVDSSGAQANGSSTGSSVSSDGLLVAFESFASNLVPGDTNGTSDIFVRDRATGTTERVSIGASGQANGSSGDPSISADGRFVAFESSASNLVPGDTNGTSDVFIRDRTTGTTERVSIGASGQANGSSGDPAINVDGSIIAFDSLASNLVSGDTNGRRDAFVRDRQAGTTERISVGSGEEQWDADNRSATISADGRFVAFESDPPAYEAITDVFIRDRQGGTTESMAADNWWTEYSGRPAISADARFVAFQARAILYDSMDSSHVASPLGDRGIEIWCPPDPECPVGIYVYDRQTLLFERIAEGDVANENSGDPSISSDGRFVSFESLVSDLVPGDTNGTWDVFARDRGNGTTSRLSVDSAGQQANNESGDVSVNADGRIFAFDSLASNLVASDSNNTWDVFAHVRAAEGGPVWLEAPLDGARFDFVPGASGSFRLRAQGDDVYITSRYFEPDGDPRPKPSYVTCTPAPDPPPGQAITDCTVSPEGDGLALMEVDAVDFYGRTAGQRRFLVAGSPLQLVVLGDSYSSGEGIGPYFRDGYDPVSDTQPGDIDNKCHRSTRAYAEYVKVPGAAQSWYKLASGGGDPGKNNKYGSDQNVRRSGSHAWAFWACSGAIHLNVLPASDGGVPQYDGKYREKYPQLDNPSVNFGSDAVALTIGGNDVGFADVLEYCAWFSCNTPEYRAQLEAAIDSMATPLWHVYREVREKTFNAKLLVLGYPQVFPAASEDQSCPKLFPWQGEQNFLREMGTRLNTVIAEAARSAGVTFVDAATHFAGHEVCTSTEWINGPSFRRRDLLLASFHPNKTGQQQDAVLVNSALAEQ